MANILKAYLFLSGTEAPGVPERFKLLGFSIRLDNRPGKC